MSRPSGLGRGLGALIPDAAQSGTDADTGYHEVPIDAITPNSNQPRVNFDDELGESLAKSVQELGVLQPLLVRKSNDGYELIAGERRWRAAQAAGLTHVPVIIRQSDDLSSLEEALVENLHRQDLNCLEEAAGYQQLVDEFSMTQAQVATRVGKSRSAVANTLRLLQLPASVQRLVSDAKLTAGHARALLALDETDAIDGMAKRIVKDDLSVRQTEALVKENEATPDLSTTSSTGGSPGKTKDAALLELEDLLSRRLDTSVSVTLGSKRGKVVIDFADLDDLERIYHIIN